MKFKITALAIAALMLGTAAHAQQARPAQSPLYGEIGYTVLNIKGDGGYDASPTAVRGIIGYDVHPMVAVEGMIAFGANDDSGTFNDGTGPFNINAKLKNAYGIYVKPKYNVTPSLEVFGRLGYTKAKVEYTEAGVSDSESTSRASYGVGLNYSFNPKMYLGVDYMRYGKKDDTKVDGVTFSLGFRF